MRPAVLSILVAAIIAWPRVVPAAEDEEPIVGDKPLSEVVKQLRSENKGLQLRAAKALIEAPAELRPRMMPRMMELLKSERENDKYVAAQILGQCGPAARAAVPELLPMLEGTQYERNRAAAAKALGQILMDAQPDEEVEKVTDSLAAKFNEDYDKYSDVRRESVRALGMIGAAAKRCVPKLTRGLTDFVLYSVEHQMVRQQAAWTCGRMGPLAAEHQDRLISMMHAEGGRIPEIVEAIGCIGPTHANVVPNIVDAMERQDGGIGWQIEAYQALEKFGPKSAPAVPLLARYLREHRQHPDVTIAAIRVLKAIGPEAKEALPSLGEYLDIQHYRSRDQNFRATTAEELQAMRTLSQEAVASIAGEKPQTAGE
jgi:HEAT repeat protein